MYDGLDENNTNSASVEVEIKVEVDVEAEFGQLWIMKYMLF